VTADLIGKGKHIRTVPVPAGVKQAVDAWTVAAGINAGAISRRVNRIGKLWGAAIAPKAIWHVVKGAAKRAGAKNLALRDLRRTCARLCHLTGGELEQIQFLLGHDRFRLPSVTWAANRDSVTRSTTTSVWMTPEDRCPITRLRGPLGFYRWRAVKFAPRQPPDGRDWPVKRVIQQPRDPQLASPAYKQPLELPAASRPLASRLSSKRGRASCGGRCSSGHLRARCRLPADSAL
jgi:hypothetical protein